MITMVVMFLRARGLAKHLTKIIWVTPAFPSPECPSFLFAHGFFRGACLPSQVGFGAGRLSPGGCPAEPGERACPPRVSLQPGLEAVTGLPFLAAGQQDRASWALWVGR